MSLHLRLSRLVAVVSLAVLMPVSAQASGLKRSPSFSQGLTVLYSFGPSPDGQFPNGITIDAAGNLFGGTSYGGQNGWGTEFELRHSGSGYTESIIDSLNGDGDGSGGSTPVEDSAGNLYFTAFGFGPAQEGTLVKLVPNQGGYTEAAIYTYGPGHGCGPVGPLLLGKILYVPTYCGGASRKTNDGTISAIHTTKLTGRLVYEFSKGYPPGGKTPGVAFAADAQGVLYGTTIGGGTNGLGTVYKFVPDRNGVGGVVSTIWNFEGPTFGDGEDPDFATLVIDAQGNIYGSTYEGGASGSGILFKLSPQNGTYVETILHTFAGGSDGAFPQSNMVLVGNTLYGTTGGGGGGPCKIGCGTIFSLSTSGTGYSILHDFAGSDGASPYSNLAWDGSTLYGTTIGGGANGDGEVFAFSP